MTPNLLNITPELSASVTARTSEVEALLAAIAHDFSPATFANSLGAEDMVLTDLILKAQLPIDIFSLDTGRLPAETYELMGAVEKHYGYKLTIFFPRADEVETYVRNQGINAFRESVTLRKACCAIRKVEPLKRALAGKRAWITGLRAQQAATRDGLPLREYDAGNGLEKFNPLAGWNREGSLDLHQAERRALQRAARQVLPEHRLRALARAPSHPARMSAPGAGGGNRRNPRSAACTSRTDRGATLPSHPVDQ